MRKKHQEAFVKKHGIKVGFMSAFVKAAASSLQAIPSVNAVIDQDEIVYRDYVDISVAVATPKVCFQVLYWQLNAKLWELHCISSWVTTVLYYTNNVGFSVILWVFLRMSVKNPKKWIVLFKFYWGCYDLVRMVANSEITPHGGQEYVHLV